ncbi:uncharacterized protein [Spinacia oleracea]|uniref:TTF-type domain-containing protein n=1 Tax=Spinacia oleracea TaxID=3562 RepID=A0A9R0J7Q1_SPIOL|nr:uncharacterized protein LOC110800539 [Spinacia oleracea]
MDHEVVRKEYIQRGPCQPKKHKISKTEFEEGIMRRFNPYWFKKYAWLEYSVSKDYAYFFYCYLFKNETTKVAGGDAFVINGFQGWNKPCRLKKHIGGVKSAHNQAFEKFGNLKNRQNSIQASLNQQCEQVKSEYEIRLTTSLHCLRFLLLQGLAFHGHDECEESSNKGNYLELYIWYADKNDEVGNVVLKNAPKNNKLIAPKIQKQIINCRAKETTKEIVEDLGKDYFGILVD